MTLMTCDIEVMLNHILIHRTLKFCYIVIIIVLCCYLHGQNQMQFSQSLGGQQFQERQLPFGDMKHGIAKSQLNQGSRLNRHINQMSSAANSALLKAEKVSK